jgi:hypothetical protein
LEWQPANWQLLKAQPGFRISRREQIRVMMRYAGPRMLWEHPIMNLRPLAGRLS